MVFKQKQKEFQKVCNVFECQMKVHVCFVSSQLPYIYINKADKIVSVDVAYVNKQTAMFVLFISRHLTRIMM